MHGYIYIYIHTHIRICVCMHKQCTGATGADAQRISMLLETDMHICQYSAGVH